MSHARSTALDLAILVSLAALVFLPGLDSHGLTNWQEAQRALVAREMHQRGDWIVPTVHDTPYLAKPPLIYWCQLAIASITASPPQAWHLRLTVALAAILAVLTTYLGARALLAPDPDDPPDVRASRTHEHAAFWASTLLAVGVLFVRSGRIGEIDVLLAAPTVTAAAAIDRAWRLARAQSPPFPRLAWIALACLCASLASLAKGPPAILAVAIACYTGQLLDAARLPLRQSPSLLSPDRLIPSLTFLVAFVPLIPRIHGATDILGVVLLALAVALLAWMVARLAAPVRALALLRTLSRTHPIALIGAGFLPLWAWGAAVRARAGPETLARAIRAETDDNLRWLVPESPLNNLEACGYALGLGSIAAVAATIWLVRDKPHVSRGLRNILAWIAATLVAFSLLGKGVARYLTPMWPALAILGGAWVGAALRDHVGSRVLARALAALILLAAIAQSAWYAVGRERFFPDRSARAFMTALGERTDTSRIAAIDLWHPGFEYYLRARIPCAIDVGPDPRHPLGPQGPLSELIDRIRADDRPWTLLVRAAAHPETDAAPPIDRLRALGLEAEVLDIPAPLTIDNGRTPIVALRARPAHATD